MKTLSEIYKKMTRIVPEGEQGCARIKHIEVTEDQAKFSSLRGSYLRPGSLCQLFVNGGLMMSDGSMEHRSNIHVVRQAQGDVLIAGLGIGMILLPIMNKEEVKSVTVIEKFPEVISLVEPSIRKMMLAPPEALTVIQADIMEWKTDKMFDVIYFDIWPEICTENLKEITYLKRRFARRVKKGGWMRAWVEDELRYKKRRDSRYESVGLY